MEIWFNVYNFGTFLQTLETWKVSGISMQWARFVTKLTLLTNKYNSSDAIEVDVNEDVSGRLEAYGLDRCYVYI